MDAATGCLPCARDWDHCHGAVVRHADGEFDCTDGPGCDLPVELHDIAVDCADAGCGCR